MKTRYLTVILFTLIIIFFFEGIVFGCDCDWWTRPDLCHECVDGVWVDTCVGCESCDEHWGLYGTCEDDDNNCGGSTPNCVDGDCVECKYFFGCETNEICCNGECVSTCYGYTQKNVYEGSCVCGIEGAITCKSNDEELRTIGIGKICRHERNCVIVPSGISGMTECDPVGARGNVCDVWTCRDDMCWPGVLLCWELNFFVCSIRCGAAWSACAVNPASPECAQGLQDCYECLTGEEIDCGCLVIDCGYDYAGYIEGDTVLLSGCPCVGS